MYNTYCKILGVNPNATINEVQRAYRNKAKLYHPDLNKSESAHMDFIRIKQAYDYITRTKKYSSHKYYTNTYAASRQYTKRYRRDFNWENYYKWKEAQKTVYQNKKKDIDFKTTYLGKFLYYFFHVMFFILGVLIVIQPIRTILLEGIDPEKSVSGTIFAVILASLFGILMIAMILMSVFNYNIRWKIK